MTPPALTVELVCDPTYVTVVLRGELDELGVPDAHAALETAAAGADHVVMDLRELEFIDSSGLKLVLAWERNLRDRGVGYSLVRGAPHVQQPFTSAGLDELLPFADRPPG